MNRRPIAAAATLAATLLLARPAGAAPLTVPFDFSQSEIALDVAVAGQPLYVLLDTGVDPSVIDSARAEALHLKLDRQHGGEADGIGDGKGVTAYPTRIEDIAIGGRSFPGIEAMTGDMGALSAHYGRTIDGVFGFSFLKDKAVLLDYPHHSATFLDGASEVKAATRSCRTRWRTPMRLLKDENWPLLTNFRLGANEIPATLDTGSSGTITLYQGVLALPGVKAALVRTGERDSTGFRGGSKLADEKFDGPIGLGPFRLPPGAAVTLRNTPGSADTSLANIGNRLFAALKIRLLLDYRGRTIGVFGDCG